MVLTRFLNKIEAIFFILLIISIFLNPSSLFAGVATLSWDPPATNTDGSPLTDLEGYKVYYGTSSGNYSQRIDVGNVTTYTVSNLNDGTYYFAVTVHDTSGNESDYSNEVSKTINSTQRYTLTINRGGTGSGIVTSSPSGINCGSDCSETYNAGTPVTLAATPGATSTFTGWSGGNCNGNGQCVLSMNSNLTVTANFSAITTSLTLSSPNGGETWQAGTGQTIRWNYTGNPGADVKIELLRGGTLNRTITSSTSRGSGGSGSYTWTIPYSQSRGNDYKVKIASTTNGTFNDIGDGNFTITELLSGPTGTSSITVTLPNGGETWHTGTGQTIRWNYTGNPGAHVKIELLKGGALNRTITSSTSRGSGGSGSYTWTIPSDQINGNDYRIKVTSTTNSSYSDTSNGKFDIITPSSPTITVTSPNGGETWHTGTSQTIRWNYTGNPGAHVKIELLRGGTLNRTITSSTSIGSGGSGSYT
ncbi:MAG: Ser-Thr-rich GPI-anchored membrane family protein [Nitrospirota bacterium]